MPKLYRVQIAYYVLAENEAKAEQFHPGIDGARYETYEMYDVSDLDEWEKDTVPYGEERGRTCQQILEGELGVDLRESLETAQEERNKPVKALSLAHVLSQKAASKAEALLAAGKADAARRLYSEAAKCEAVALRATAQDKPRTRAILAISAISLFFKGGDIQRAEALAHAFLAQNDLPLFARNQLCELLDAELFRESHNVALALWTATMGHYPGIEQHISKLKARLAGGWL